MTRLLIVGAGVAAVSAAEAARRTDPALEITLVGDEPYLPYYRTRLSHLLGKPMPIEQLLLHPASWYDDRSIELKLGLRASAVDLPARAVDFGDRRISYDTLILANGSRSFLPPLPGNDLPGVFTLRSYSDLLGISERVADRERVLISGGGPLGLEAAWALRQAGKRVTVLERGDGLLRRQLDPAGADLLRRIAERNGITVRVGAELTGIVAAEDHSQGLSARLADGQTIQADVVLFSTGVRPNTELAATAGLTVNRGVVVDQRMKTSADGIFAAGDVAICNGKSYGIWPVAQEQGRVAGINAAGGDAAYSEIAPSNTIMVLGTSVYAAGEVADEGSVALRDGDEAAGTYRAAFIRDGILTGVSLIGDTGLGSKLKQAIDAKSEVRAATSFADLAALLA